MRPQYNKKKNQKKRSSQFFMSLMNEYGPMFPYKIKPYDVERKINFLFRDFLNASIDLETQGDYFHMGFPNAYTVIEGIPKTYNSLGQEVDINGDPMRDINGNFVMRPDKPENTPPIMMDLSGCTNITFIAYNIAKTRMDMHSFYKEAAIHYIQSSQRNEAAPMFEPSLMENCRSAADWKATCYGYMTIYLGNFIQDMNLEWIHLMMGKLVPFRGNEL